MLVSLIVAVARNGVIGTDAGLPWHLPRDLRQFRVITTGKPIVMGRRTLDHIGRPLPDRANIVLTRRADFAEPGFLVAHAVDEALAVAKREAERLGANEVVVIGGGEVYRAFLPHTDRLYVTVVEGEFTGTAFFPVDQVEWSKFAVTATVHHPADAKNPHPHTFWQLDRRDAKSPHPPADPRSLFCPARGEKTEPHL